MSEASFQSKAQLALHDLKRGQYPRAAELISDLRREPVTERDDCAVAGELCLAAGEVELAIGFISLALKDDLDDAELLIRLADAYTRSGAFGDALSALDRAEKIAPDQLEAQLILARIYLALQQIVPARDTLEKALAQDRNNPEAHCNLARVHAMLEDLEQADTHARRAVELAPKSVEILNVSSAIMLSLGKPEEAKKLLERGRRLDPRNSDVYHNLATLRRHSDDDAEFIAQGESILEEALAPRSRGQIHFALGKLYDDCGDHDRAFEHFRRGNVLRRPAEPKDPNELFALAKDIEFPACRDVLGDLPVFIVGMPRSGTTLLEQVLSSHADVAGAGELRALGTMTIDLVNLSKAGELTAEACEEALENYRAQLTSGREGTLRVTDKMPGNYVALGVVQQLMPNARILHCQRDPIDTCLSCYFQNFEGQSWSHDFGDIARAYDGYRRIMDQWQDALPEGRVLGVHYERLVDDLETEARRIVEHLGLPWDPACLEFASNVKGAMTASRDQVRQPIYRTSMQRWERYATHLGPLLDGLAPYLGDHAEALERHGIRLKSSRSWLKRLFG